MMVSLPNRMSGRHRQSLILLAVALCGGQARAADAITQDRDEPGRNPLQQTVDGGCTFNNTCVCQFSAVPDHYRYVVTSVSAEIASSTADPPIAQLTGSAYTLPQATGVRSPRTWLATSSAGYNGAYYYFVIHDPTTAYFLWIDTPYLLVSTQGVRGQSPAPIIALMTCTISGDTVTET